MGQLEKYGLYVLCLVIFLILAVTIWPGDVAASPEQRNAAVRYEDSALNGGNGNGRSNSDASHGEQSEGDEHDTNLPIEAGTRMQLIRSADPSDEGSAYAWL